MAILERVLDAVATMIKLEGKVTGYSDVAKRQQLKIEDLTGRIIRLEAQLELITSVASVRRSPRQSQR